MTNTPYRSKFTHHVLACFWDAPRVTLHSTLRPKAYHTHIVTDLPAISAVLCSSLPQTLDETYHCKISMETSNNTKGLLAQCRFCFVRSSSLSEAVAFKACHHSSCNLLTIHACLLTICSARVFDRGPWRCSCRRKAEGKPALGERDPCHLLHLGLSGLR